MSNSKKKIITRAERQAKMAAKNEKLNNHINQGVENFVQDIYTDRKEARLQQRWAATGEALKDAELKAREDADSQFLEELTQAQEGYYARLDAEYEAEEKSILEAEDDIIDVEFKPLPSRESRRTNRRQSLLGSGSSNPLLSGSSNNVLSASTLGDESPKPDRNKSYGKRPLPE